MMKAPLVVKCLARGAGLCVIRQSALVFINPVTHTPTTYIHTYTEKYTSAP